MRLGLCHLYDKQKITQMNILMRHTQSNTVLGKLTEIALYWWKVNTGVLFSLLQHPTTKIGYIGKMLFTLLQDFINSLNITITIPSIHKALPKKLCIYDTFLMENLIKLNITKTKRKHFNIVWLWMKVLRLLEICTEDGDNITQGR